MDNKTNLFLRFQTRFCNVSGLNLLNRWKAYGSLCLNDAAFKFSLQVKNCDFIHGSLIFIFYCFKGCWTVVEDESDGIAIMESCPRGCCILVSELHNAKPFILNFYSSKSTVISCQTSIVMNFIYKTRSTYSLQLFITGFSNFINEHFHQLINQQVFIFFNRIYLLV